MNLKMRLKTIHLRTAQTKRRLQELKRDYLFMMWLHKEIKRTTFKRWFPAMNLEKVALKYSKRAKTKKYQNNDASLLLLIGLADKEMNKAINKSARKLESEMKKSVISQELKFNRINATDDDSAKIFYLCSKHGDCAEDHEDYQGKIYVDSGWKSAVKDKARVQKAIDKLNAQSFQWVLGSPAYLVTRPNCRHYFEALSLNEVENASIETLLKTHNMIEKTGPKNALQTPRRLKEEKLLLHERMYKAKPSEYLRKVINKEKLLFKTQKA